MNRTIVVLTKSSKYGAYCVAGLDCDTGEFVRLVSEDVGTKGALTNDDITYEDGSHVKRLDVIQVEVCRDDDNIIQPENVVVDRSYYFGFKGEMNIRDSVELYFSNNNEDDYILGNSNYFLFEYEAQGLGESLSLAIVDNIVVHQEFNQDNKPKTKVSFDYNSNHYRYMTVTDSDYYFVEDGLKYDRAVVVVSIGDSWNGKHYKFVSAIYPLG